MKKTPLSIWVGSLWLWGMLLLASPSFAYPIDSLTTSIEEAWLLYKANDCAGLEERAEQLEAMLDKEQAGNTQAYEKLSIILARHNFYQTNYDRAFELMNKGFEKGKNSAGFLLEWAWMGVEAGLLEKSEQAMKQLESDKKGGLLSREALMDYLFVKAEKERIVGKGQGVLSTPLEEHLPFVNDEGVELTAKEKIFKALLFQVWGAGLVSTKEQFDELNKVGEYVQGENVPPYLKAYYWSKMASTGIGNQANDSVRQYLAFSNAAFDLCYAKTHVARSYPATKEAFFFWNTGEYQEMLELLDGWEAEVLRQELDDHYTLPFIWRNQAGAHSRVGNNEKAITLAKKAVLKMERLHPGGHRELDIFYNTLANSYGSADLDNPDFQLQSLKTYEKALKLRKRYYPPQDRGVILYQQNIGMTYFFLGQTEKAFSIYEEALQNAIEGLDQTTFMWLGFTSTLESFT